jgi:hypothetical protein
MHLEMFMKAIGGMTTRRGLGLHTGLTLTNDIKGTGKVAFNAVLGSMSGLAMGSPRLEVMPASSGAIDTLGRWRMVGEMVKAPCFTQQVCDA